jgi:hypothetical protein
MIRDFWPCQRQSRTAILRGERGIMATVFEQVRAFIIRLAGEPVCDDCIADRLGLSVRQHANHKTRELAGEAGFERTKDACALCEGVKLVIRH